MSPYNKPTPHEPRTQDSPAAPVAPPTQRNRWPRFTLATMFRLMVIASVLAAALGGLLRGKQVLEKSGTGSATFVVLALVAPLAVLIAVSVVANGSAAAIRAYRLFRGRR